tara:strand:+ start:106 stop:327 length:222 start_codon:yes stop_codon:yes gene_type:complete
MEIKLKVDPALHRILKEHFKNDEQKLMQFINEAIRIQLQNFKNDFIEKEDELESYLKKGEPGSRTYGVKGQGW